MPRQDVRMLLDCDGKDSNQRYAALVHILRNKYYNLFRSNFK